VIIRRTVHGVPHIEASSYRGLGYGYGHAFARDNICTIADDYVTVNAERSRWFGPRGTSRRLAGQSRNLASDLFWRQIIDSRVVERLPRAQAAPWPERRSAEPDAGVRVGLQRLPAARRRRARRARPAVPRQALGAADHHRHGVPPRVSDRDGDQQRQPDPGDRAGAAAAAGAVRVGAAGGGRLHRAARAQPFAGQQRDRGRPGRDARSSPRAAARQPAPAVERHGPLLPGPSDDSRPNRRAGRFALRRAGDPDRPHARGGVEPHDRARAGIHALPAQAHQGLADVVPRRRPAGADDEPTGDGAGAGA
jgi:hypothetical protein